MTLSASGDIQRISLQGRAWNTRAVALVILVVAATWRITAQENADCLACHGDRSLTSDRKPKPLLLFVDGKKFGESIHGSLTCVSCHAGLAGKELPHDWPVAKVDCGSCHADEARQHAESLHGKAIALGDQLAPRCVNCHGDHDITRARAPNSNVAPQRIPYVCGKCHTEGTPVTRQREIHQSNILENYSESIHGEALLKKGLVVTATCVSCHTAHLILPHTDARSSIARKNIARTCTQCHAQIENVHRRIIRGELWEKEAHTLPACVDCHQPHKVRQVFYDQGMADSDCLTCHARKDIVSSKDGRSLFVDLAEIKASKHSKTSCSQCHAQVNVSRRRPCETITANVDCSSCHAEIGAQYQKSTHGVLAARHDSNAPICSECHGTHGILAKRDPQSRTFPTNVPDLCARCHREGNKAAVRYTGDQHQIIERYTESIHGKGLLKSGLTVTAMCTDCHTAHGELPRDDPASSVNPKNLPATCGRCHHGIPGTRQAWSSHVKCHTTRLSSVLPELRTLFGPAPQHRTAVVRCAASFLLGK